MDKELMAEAAILYYEKKLTQQEIADVLYMSRQTVSKLLSAALAERIVEIKVHHPRQDCEALSAQLQSRYGIKKAVVCSAGSKTNEMRLIRTVKAAAEYVVPLFETGGQHIAVSWGRTVQNVIAELPVLRTDGNTVFPLFGATDHENSRFTSNELARSLADTIGAAVKYAWFPYLPDSEHERELLLKTSYFKRLYDLWDTIDIAIVGIGNTEIVDLFTATFGHADKRAEVIGDIATHFFTRSGKILNLYKHTLCASAAALKKAKKTIAVACGSDKIEAIGGALLTGVIDVFITDEHTAKELLDRK